MIFDKILEQCTKYYKLATDLDSEVEEFEQQFANQFAEPTPEDKQDFQILVRRALKGNPQKLISSLIVLDRLARNFRHESFSEEFYEFISDEDIFNWAHSVKDKSELSEFDKGYLWYIARDLAMFSDGNIFK